MIALTVTAVLSGVLAFVIASAMASGGAEDAYLAGYRDGHQAGQDELARDLVAFGEELARKRRERAARFLTKNEAPERRTETKEPA